jgi:DNA-binding NarL/FixJ family response regulator
MTSGRQRHYYQSAPLSILQSSAIRRRPFSQQHGVRVVLNVDSDKMMGSAIRVLIVDDFDPWCRFLRSTLERQPGFTIVGEVSDGLLATQKAEELLPDLILLDVGLPNLNGIEVARQIRQRPLKSKILFVSENQSSDIAHEALQVGGNGYVVKSRGARELLPAVEAVLRGEQFISIGLDVEKLLSFVNRDSTRSFLPEKTILPLPPRNIPIRHEVAFYEDDSEFVKGFATTTAAVLRVGNSAILIATEPHRANILQRLRKDRGVDVDVAIESGKFIQLDAIDALAKIMIHELPDPANCARVVSDLLELVNRHSKRGTQRVAICGECAPSLLSQGNVQAAVRLEHLWDEVTSGFEVDTLCGYSWESFPGREANPLLQEICAEHTAVHGRELGY